MKRRLSHFPGNKSFQYLETEPFRRYPRCCGASFSSETCDTLEYLKDDRTCDISTHAFLHDGNPLDGENQARNTIGILNKIGAWLLSFWIIIVESRLRLAERPRREVAGYRKRYQRCKPTKEKTKRHGPLCSSERSFWIQHNFRITVIEVFEIGLRWTVFQVQDIQ